MLLIAEPWTPEQWERAWHLERIYMHGRFCGGNDRMMSRMFYEWFVAPMRDFSDLPAMSLADFKRELARGDVNLG
ncbi:MAG: hypothetical protein VW625_05595 [Perlucidibaca sp.]